MCCGAFCRLCAVAGMQICSLPRGNRMIFPMQGGSFGRLLGRSVGCGFLGLVCSAVWSA